ncbi:MAG: S8 family serine peptidase [Ferruginibacter sp.]|nr:S8 family serine peptidase [Ferruginibacter sp.]
MKKLLQLLVIGLLFTNLSFGQEKEEMPKDWHLLDPATTGYNGISLDKAYEFLKSQNIKSKRVVVAVIDSGIDTLHEDLKPVLWINKKEIAGNKIDDDKNGYPDDLHGWNLLGGKDGKNVGVDSYEAARVYYALKPVWDDKDVDTLTLNSAQKKEYSTFLRAKAKVTGNANDSEVKMVEALLPKLLTGDSVIRKELGKEEYNATDLENYKTENGDAKMARGFLINISKANGTNEISNTDLINEFNAIARKGKEVNTPPPAYRKDIVGDDETNINDRDYGNNDIMASTPFHGTHCSGIIGAKRDNGIGINGIADNVEIMMIRAVPDGDEHDKDIALAIRYAVDNGAKVISMSFGKDFSPEKEWVDDAFRYAEKKGVLLVHAAGNDRKNIDTTYNFPTGNYLNGGVASNLITVGASGDKKNGGLTASFSNYGKRDVDLFAPGVGIYSTIPGGNTYGNASGTSMACPVVAGVAALILEYYPTLTPQQVKLAIEKSVNIPTEKVKNPGTGDDIELSELCKTGGFLNAYGAVKAASEIAAKQKIQTPKPRVINNKL